MTRSDETVRRAWALLDGALALVRLREEAETAQQAVEQSRQPVAQLWQLESAQAAARSWLASASDDRLREASEASLRQLSAGSLRQRSAASVRDDEESSDGMADAMTALREENSFSYEAEEERPPLGREEQARRRRAHFDRRRENLQQAAAAAQGEQAQEEPPRLQAQPPAPLLSLRDLEEESGAKRFVLGHPSVKLTGADVVQAEDQPAESAEPAEFVAGHLISELYPVRGQLYVGSDLDAWGRRGHFTKLDDSAVLHRPQAVAIGGSEHGSACGPEMTAGVHCARFTLRKANAHGSLPYVGVVGKGFNPQRGDASESSEGWMLNTNTGRMHHSGVGREWDGQPDLKELSPGDMIAMVLCLSTKTLRVYAGGRLLGQMIAPEMRHKMRPPMRWAVDVWRGYPNAT